MKRSLPFALALTALVSTCLFAEPAPHDEGGPHHKDEFPVIDTSKLPAASTQTGVTYVKDIHPIFDQSGCFQCHGERRQKGRLRLDSIEAVMRGGKDGKIVEPGNSVKSWLVVAVSRLDSDSAMPPEKHKHGRPEGAPEGAPHAEMPKATPLTADQVGLVRAWIDQGAK